jgi:hypothetical protein
MKISPFYAAWGLAVLLLLGTAQWRGWSLTPTSVGKANPRSVRANPGSYRPSYYVPGRVLRGK